MMPQVVTILQNDAVDDDDDWLWFWLLKEEEAYNYPSMKSMIIVIMTMRLIIQHKNEFCWLFIDEKNILKAAAGEKKDEVKILKYTL